MIHTVKWSKNIAQRILQLWEIQWGGLFATGIIHQINKR